MRTMESTATPAALIGPPASFGWEALLPGHYESSPKNFSALSRTIPALMSSGSPLKSRSITSREWGPNRQGVPGSKRTT
jgi:hypothetical protein